jgi:hypothetical protein
VYSEIFRWVPNALFYGTKSRPVKRLGARVVRQFEMTHYRCPIERPLTPTPPRGTLYLMVVTCLLGMSIPVGPVSKHNPVLSAKRLRCAYSRFVKRLALKRLNEEKHWD